MRLFAFSECFFPQLVSYAFEHTARFLFGVQVPSCRFFSKPCGRSWVFDSLAIRPLISYIAPQLDVNNEPVNNKKLVIQIRRHDNKKARSLSGRKTVTTVFL